MNNAGDHLRRAPFVRILLPFIAGICLGELLNLPRCTIWLVLPVFFILLTFYPKLNTFRNDFLKGVLLLAVLFSLGVSFLTYSRYEPQKLYGKSYSAVLDDYPEERENSYRALIRLIDPGIKVLCYFEKSSNLSSLKPGTLIYFKGSPDLIKNLGNPFEFDFRTYCLRKNIGHKIYLSSDDFYFSPSQKLTTFKHRMLILRKKILGEIAESGVEGEVLKVVSAITLGCRDDINAETIRSFSRTGTIHILAVSGGNLVFIFIFLNFIFSFLRKLKFMILYMSLIITGIWAYTIITGLSPSVLRAATMFTFLIIGNNSRRNPSIYNSLASSAFVLLCVKPSLLFDVGFQLSYAAVTGIVFLQPKIYGLLRLKYWFADKIWILFTVSVAAQIGTSPLSIYYFHQFPNYFWVTNVVVVPMMGIFLFLSFGILLLSPLFPCSFSSLTGYLLQFSGTMMLDFLKITENLPFAVIENIYPFAHQILLIILFFIFFVFYLLYKSVPSLVAALSTFVIFLALNSITLFMTLNRYEIVVFNIPGKKLVAFTSGKETTWITDNNEEMDYFTGPYQGFRRINTTERFLINDLTLHSNNILAMKENFIRFCGNNILFVSKQEMPDIESLNIDMIFMPDKVYKTPLNSNLRTIVISPPGILNEKTKLSPVKNTGESKSLTLQINHQRR